MANTLVVPRSITIVGYNHINDKREAEKDPKKWLPKAVKILVANDVAELGASHAEMPDSLFIVFFDERLKPMTLSAAQQHLMSAYRSEPAPTSVTESTPTSLPVTEPTG